MSAAPREMLDTPREMLDALREMSAAPHEMSAAPHVMSAATCLMFVKDQKGRLDVPPGPQGALLPLYMKKL